MSKEKGAITVSERELVIKMDSVKGCFIRPHRLRSGGRGFRLLDKERNPLQTVRYDIVHTLVEQNYLIPLHQGECYFIYMRTDKKLNRYEH